MATFGSISGAEPSTITFKARTVKVTQNSTVMQQEILAIGDPDTSNAVAAVIAATPGSTAWGLVVREAATKINIGSTAADNAVLITPVSTAFVKLAGFGVDSSNALSVKTDPSIRHNIGSTAADNLVQVSGNSTVLIADATGTKIDGSSGSPSTGAYGLVVRQVINNLQTFASSNAFNASSAASIASSNAALRAKVYAYSITSTNQAPTKVAFFDGATLKWPVVLGALSSAVTGANLAVSPPAYLFTGSTGQAMTLNIPSAGAGWKVGVSYFLEP